MVGHDGAKRGTYQVVTYLKIHDAIMTGPWLESLSSILGSTAILFFASDEKSLIIIRIVAVVDLRASHSLFPRV